jgi:ornithine decarboxylase
LLLAAGTELGFTMDILDIGGGFCAGAIQADGSVDMGGVPSAVNAALELHFPVSSGVRIIAEPGRLVSALAWSPFLKKIH